jgi:hypothetical protein
LVFGPLFLFGLMKSADGRPTTDAGIALCIMSVPLCLVCALAVFNLMARRRPILRLCREGLEVNQIGVSSLDGVPLVPGWIRVAWLILSRQGFRQELVRTHWQTLESVHTGGVPMARTLTIDAAFYRRADADGSPSISQLCFREVAFEVPVDHIALAVNGFAHDPDSRGLLPSWND